MAKINVKTPNTAKTHEGAPALPPRSALLELRRAVSGCLLWEDQFYESGEDIAQRIATLSRQVRAEDVAALAVEARTVMGLRHAPLWMTLGLFGREEPVRHLKDAVAGIIGRADEMGEMVAMYWKDGKKPLPAAMKKGLAEAFEKFDAYQLGKYDRKSDVRLRDILRLTHPKPASPEQAAMWKSVIDGTLASPDTWEVNLSGGAEKKDTWERLLRDGKLGYLALIRNLRNMEKAKVDRALVREAILARKGARLVFPFRFIAAARAAPEFEPVLEEAFLAEMAQRPKLPGRTLVVADVSGSMNFGQVSAKSDMSRMDAGAALCAIARELCEDPVIYATAGNDGSRKHATAKVPARRGLALVDAVRRMPETIGGGGIFTKQVCDFLREKEGEVDRLIILTDEQDCGVGHGDSPLAADPIGRHNYMINVSSYKNGVAHGKWTAISGFSENVMRYISEVEKDPIQLIQQSE